MQSTPTNQRDNESEPFDCSGQQVMANAFSGHVIPDLVITDSGDIARVQGSSVSSCRAIADVECDDNIEIRANNLTVRVNLDAFQGFRYTDEVNELLTIRTERVDDLPLLLTQMQRMGIAHLLDAHLPTGGDHGG